MYLCGDGLVSVTEKCDCGDNNGLGNGCSDDCMSSLPGWKCTGGSLTSATTCVPICGDGL